MLSIFYIVFSMLAWWVGRLSPEVGLLLGKLHLNRCVLDPRETHVAKKECHWGG